GFNHGANATSSAILGGLNNNIASGNIGAVVLGGNSIKLTGSSYTYTTAVNRLAIFGSLSGGTNSDSILTYDPITKLVRSRSTSDVLSTIAAAKGPVGAIQYHNGSQSFSGTTLFSFDVTSRSFTLGTRSGVYGVFSFT